MSGNRAVPDDSHGALFDDIVEWIVTGMLVFAPLAFGGTEAWSQEVLLAGAGIALLVVTLKHALHAATPWLWTWAYVPIVLFLALVMFQLVPLPITAFRGPLAGSRLLRDEFLPGGIAALGRVPITLYAWATAHELPLVCLPAAMFVVVLDVYRTWVRIERLLMVIIAVGLAVAGLSVYQIATGATTVYGLVPMQHKHVGPFMNYSHFSQFVNLSLGAGIAMLLVKFDELREFYRTPAEVAQALRQPNATTLAIAAAAMLWVIGPITILLSMSRMGAISMIVAFTLTIAMLALRGGDHSSHAATSRSRSNAKGQGEYASIVLTIGLVVFAILLITGFNIAYARLATVRNAQATGGFRVELLRDLLPVFRLFPLLGSGLATHEFVFPLFNHLNTTQITTHAENEYAQLLEECGGVGLALALAFVGIIAMNAWRVLRRSPLPSSGYVAFGLCYGLIAIIVHSASDFGQHVPANAMLTATFAALLVVLGHRAFADSGEAAESRGLSAGLRAGMAWAALRWGGVAVAAAGLVAVLPFADRGRRAEAAYDVAQSQATPLEKANWAGSNEAYLELLQPATLAASLEPSNAVYQYWLNAFRWHAIAHDVDPSTGQLRLAAPAAAFAKRIVDALEAIRPLCPMYGPPVGVAGQIRYAVLGQGEEGAQEIGTAYRLTPYDQTTCWVTGILNTNQANWPEAEVAFRRYIVLGGDARDVSAVYVAAGRTDLAFGLAQGDRQRLMDLAGRLDHVPDMQVWSDRCRDEARSLLTTEAARPDAPADVLAASAEQAANDHQPAEAVRLYRRALIANYGEVSWRLGLAHALVEAGQPGEAAREAAVCLRLRPESADARDLVVRFGGRPTETAAGHPVGS